MRCVKLKGRISKGEKRDSHDTDLKMVHSSCFPRFGSALGVPGRGEDAVAVPGTCAWFLT